MRLEHDRGIDDKTIVMDHFMLVNDDPVLKITFSRSGSMWFRAGCVAAIALPMGLGVWAVATTGAHPNLPWVLAYCVISMLMMGACQLLDSGFSPLTFDRRNGMIERRGRLVGALNDVSSIHVADRPPELDMHRYVVLLVLSGPTVHRLKLVKLGWSSERLEALAYADAIADFLGVHVGEGEPRQPMPKPKPHPIDW